MMTTIKPDENGKIKIVLKGDKIIQDLARIVLEPDQKVNPNENGKSRDVERFPKGEEAGP